jgi:uncharacterized protein (TIGR02757 family)
MYRPSAAFPAHLEALYRQFPFDRSLAQDPLSLVRPFREDPRSAEAAGLFAATLALGNVTAIRGSFRRLVDLAGGDLRAWIEGSRSAERARALASFRHRWVRGDQLSCLADRVERIWREAGSLEEVFRAGRERDGAFAGGLDALARALRGDDGFGSLPSPPAGYRRLFPSPLDAHASPCKRLTLYLRWMVRSTYPDLGLWRGVPTADLRIPLDLHVHWIAYHLGLTDRRTRNWRTVEEVTGALRALDPGDPIKYDFVLCHTGISGDCPKERDLSVCGPCLVRADCRLWHPRRVRRMAA